MSTTSVTHDISGKVVLVLGGAGMVGGSIALALLLQGATIAVPSRSQERLRNLTERYSTELAKAEVSVEKAAGKLLIFEEDVSTKEGALRFLASVKAHPQGGRVDHVVSSFGSWARDGPLVDRSIDDFRRNIHDKVEVHFVALTALLPAIADQEGSSYTIITGASGEQLVVPGSGLITVANQALYGVSYVVRTEFKDRAVRINELRIGFLVKRQDTDEGLQQWEVSDKKVGTIGAGLVTDSAIKGQVVRLAPNTYDFAKLDKAKA